jgi:hypothetical protein
MKTIRHLFCMASALTLLISCASTGVIPIGKDTYTISKQTASGFQSAVSIRGEVLKEANDYCRRNGLKMAVVSINAKDGVPGRSYATVDLVFRGVPSRGSAYGTRTNFDEGADTIIEVRNR